MTTQQKREEIKRLTLSMLQELFPIMEKQVDKVLDSSGVDIEGWDKDYTPMILPKCIITAILEQNATQYRGKGTSFEKVIRKEVENIRYYI